MIRRVAALAAAAIVLAGCGGDDGGRFDDQVAQVREAVEAGDRESALAALDAIALLGVDGQGSGALSDAELAELQALVDQGRALVDQQLPAAEPTSAAPPPDPAPEPAPEPPAEERGDDDEDDDEDDGEAKGKGKGKGNGKGKGRGGGDD